MIASIPREIIQCIEKFTEADVTGFAFAGGGCINSGGRLTTSSGPYFLKWNDSARFPGMLEAEARGLSVLRKAHALGVPEVIHAGIEGGFQFLLLEYIAEGRKAPGYWKNFGAGLATLHLHSSSAFGLDHDNYIGSLPQQNKAMPLWADFFIEQRLKPQLQIGRDQGRVDSTITRKFDRLFNRLASLLPEESPSLLHGDLWSGNLMTDGMGQPCLIDPAVYYGNREADLAMTQLFGGFEPLFLESYHRHFPLIPGYKERFDIYNLYPLLVHVNLFGGGYRAQVVSILTQLV